tara:strand:+ start:230 stop:1906 length:1677 start_codon:yes stop_codon:yes gene_type:complete
MSSEYNINYSIAISSVLERLGVKYVCISPGARNSPLIYAFAEVSNIKCYSHIDERSSAFFGLGLAKFSKEPTVLICTSGTAGANYYPALIEASYSRIPLIVLTADRPKRLIESGANQTINQSNLYGNFIRNFIDVGLPNNNFNDLLPKIELAYNYSKGLEFNKPPGPVHINCPFEEPLFPSMIENSDSIIINKLNVPKINLKKAKIPLLKSFNRPVIIVGPYEENTYQEEIIALANKLGAPILADPLSQLRYGYNDSLIISNYDYIFRVHEFNPDLIIRFGRKPVSKILNGFLDKNNDKIILVDPWDQFNDDSKYFIKSDIRDYCLYQIKYSQYSGSNEWKHKFLKLESLITEILIENLEFSEGSIAQSIVESLRDNDIFIIGNSMPIRDVDMFSLTSKTKFFTFANRGASGIDGVLSTSFGINENYTSGDSVLLIGDISFLHDIGGLLAIDHEYQITIVINNNSGGGIFSFLPISNSGIKKFDKFWTTNRNINIKKIAELYNCHHYPINNLMDFKKTLLDSFSIKGVKIIEVEIDIDMNVKSHELILNRISKQISDI